MHAPTQVWKRKGLLLGHPSGADRTVVGDPCIVWDAPRATWRMFLFMDPPGCGQTLCLRPEDAGPGSWSAPWPVEFTNPKAILGGYAHKPFVVLEARHLNRAARVEGVYCLLLVTRQGSHKRVQRAWSSVLDGPWEVDPLPLIAPGQGGEPDAAHVDAVSGYYFPERKQYLYYYMATPARPQRRSGSPWGSAVAAAVGGFGSPAVKVGPVLEPDRRSGHWASGWVGGLQLLPHRSGSWMAVVNASPTPPDPTDERDSREEPPPSLGGLACCTAPWPVGGWRFDPDPLQRTSELPEAALQEGEGVNFWRHHVLALPRGRYLLVYNSGPYGRERLFARETRDPFQIRRPKR